MKSAEISKDDIGQWRLAIATETVDARLDTIQESQDDSQEDLTLSDSHGGHLNPHGGRLKTTTNSKRSRLLMCL